jgi:hypothetical protein
VDEAGTGTHRRAGGHHPGGADDGHTPAGPGGVVIGVGLEGDDGAPEGVGEGAAGLSGDHDGAIAQRVRDRPDRRQSGLGVGDPADRRRAQQAEALLLIERLVLPVVVRGRHRSLLTRGTRSPPTQPARGKRSSMQTPVRG